jgi:hypothetical protein
MINILKIKKPPIEVAFFIPIYSDSQDRLLNLGLVLL